jgi:hypothetical protein
LIWNQNTCTRSWLWVGNWHNLLTSHGQWYC